MLWLYLILLVLTLASPFIARWMVDNKWRGNMQDRRCGVCGRSWWVHHRKGYIVTCPGKKS